MTLRYFGPQVDIELRPRRRGAMWSGSLVSRRRIVEHRVFKLDGIRLLHHCCGRFPANMCLRGEAAAIMVPSVASQFSGQGAKFVDGRQAGSPLRGLGGRPSEDTMASSSIHQRCPLPSRGPRSLSPLAGIAEAVPDAAFGEDVFRRVGVVAELLGGGTDAVRVVGAPAPRTPGGATADRSPRAMRCLRGPRPRSSSAT